MNLPLAAWLGLSFFISERLLAWRRHSSKTPDGTSADDGTLRLLWIVNLLAVAAGMVVALWPLGPALPHGVPWGAVSLAVFVLGAVLRWWAIIHLGRFFTVDVAVAKDQTVVDTGPYRAVRHPSYTGVLMQFAGLALSLNNVFALPVILVPIFVALRRRMQVEEKALLGALGKDYAAYCHRTKRLVPMVY